MPGSLESFLMGIRVCLLKQKDPQLYQQVVELYSEFSLPCEESTELLENSLRELLVDERGLDIPLEEIGKLLRIFCINCFKGGREEEPTSSNPSSGYSITGLYVQSCRINHSCIPNCHWEVGPKPEFKIKIRTTRTVKKGEPLTVFYCTEVMDEVTQHRQEGIRKKVHFRCECPRCKDPTELGTYRSAIVCQPCRRYNALGYVLPEDPLNLRPDAKWKCSSCQAISLAGDILPQVEEFQQGIKEMQTDFGSDPHDDRLIEFCKRFVRQNSGMTLHPNHWTIQKAMTVMGDYILTYRQKTMSLEWSKYFVKCWRHLLSIQDLLSPGITYSRAIIQKQLGCALYQQCVDLVSRRKFEQVERNTEESLALLKEALKFFKDEVPTADGNVPTAQYIEAQISIILRDRPKINLLQLNVSRPKK